MDITFYNNASDPETIGKSLTDVRTLSGNLKDDCDIINPRIVVENYLQGAIEANYCYIPSFGRYYFIDKQVILSNVLVALYLSVDVLETYKDQIKNVECIIDKSTTDNDKYLMGAEWLTKVKTTTTIKNFPSGLNESGSFILITAGG